MPTNQTRETNNAKKKLQKPQPVQPTIPVLETQLEQANPAAALQRASAAPPPAIRPVDILTLQRMVGNQAAAHLLATRGRDRDPAQPVRPSYQTELTVGLVGEKKPLVQYASNHAVQRALNPTLLQRENGDGEAKDVTVARNILKFVEEDHPDWKSVVEGIYSGAADVTKMGQLIANFKKNGMGFKYLGARGNYSLSGDCGSLVRTFKDIAENVLLVEGEVKVRYHSGSPGWYVASGVHEIDPSRDPNMDNGSYYFKTSHVWAEWNGTVYDVLFGEKGQNGRKADEGKYVDKNGKKVWHFRIGDQWYRSVGESNTYSRTGPPE